MVAIKILFLYFLLVPKPTHFHTDETLVLNNVSVVSSPVWSSDQCKHSGDGPAAATNHG